MIKFFSFAMAFLCSSFHAQQQIQVLDAETQKPVPYAKLILKGKDYYRNTEENGKITLEKDEEPAEIESFGYENFRTEKFQSVYLLKSKFIEISEVEIVRPKFQRSFKIGSIKNNSVGFSASTVSWMVVDLFKIQEYKEKLFIKKIKIPTKVVRDVKEATFNLVFYNNENGKPSKEKINSILVSCKSGKNIIEIDLSKKPILLPKDGYFIGFEWIINEQNKYMYITDIRHYDGSREKNVNRQGIAPKLSSYETDFSNIFFNSSNLSWHKITHDKKISKNNYSLSIELQLTN